MDTRKSKGGVVSGSNTNMKANGGAVAAKASDGGTGKKDSNSKDNVHKDPSRAVFDVEWFFLDRSKQPHHSRPEGGADDKNGGGGYLAVSTSDAQV